MELFMKLNWNDTGILVTLYWNYWRNYVGFHYVVVFKWIGYTFVKLNYEYLKVNHHPQGLG